MFQALKDGGATGTELAAHLGVTKQAVSNIVGDLEAMGYLRRGPHASGGRRRLIQLTARRGLTSAWRAAYCAS